MRCDPACEQLQPENLAQGGMNFGNLELVAVQVAVRPRERFTHGWLNGNQRGHPLGPREVVSTRLRGMDSP